MLLLTADVDVVVRAARVVMMPLVAMPNSVGFTSTCGVNVSRSPLNAGLASQRVLVGPETGDLVPAALEKAVATAKVIAPVVDGRIVIR